jgi:tRNA A37 threonylcarbamoyladenosine synthetase subunit TsaC/SUA5/YrdC
MPVVSTSANFTGGKPVLTFEQARRLFKNTAGIILENHASLIGSPSTVIDLVSPLPKILRVGAISRDQILEVL